MVAERKNINPPKIPIALRTKARNLYVTQGLSAKVVAAELNLRESQLRNMAQRYGWGKQRLLHANEVSAKADERMATLSDEVEQTINDECEGIALDSLSYLRDRVQKRDAQSPKDAQALSATVRNLVAARAAIRGKVAEGGAVGAATQVNLFFFRHEQHVSSNADKDTSCINVSPTAQPAAQGSHAASGAAAPALTLPPAAPGS